MGSCKTLEVPEEDRIAVGPVDSGETPPALATPTPSLPIFSCRTFQNSSCSSHGPTVGARRGFHVSAQPRGLPGITLRAWRRSPLVCQPAEARLAPATLDAGAGVGDPLLGHGVGGGRLRPWGSIAQLTFPWASPGFLAQWATVPALKYPGRSGGGSGVHGAAGGA